MILITGLQRSGTSLSAQLLSAIGLDFGKPELLVPPDEWNPRGYYENVDVLVLNDKIALGKFAPAKQYRTRLPEQRGIGLRLSMTLFRGMYLMAGHQREIVAER